MVKMQKTLGILLALCFLLSVTAGAASAYNDGYGKEKFGHHAKEKFGHHAKFGEFKRVAVCCFDGNCIYNCDCSDEDNCNCNDDEDDNNDEDDC